MFRLAIQRPIAICMLFLALALIGGVSFRRLAVDLLPSITHPRLTVVTTYEDIPAEDLERLVTRPLEEVVTALSGVRNVISRTREGVSVITVEYEWGTDMDFANLHLREALDRVAFRDDFPEDSERPLILRWDPTSRPISVLVLEGDGPMGELTEFAREVVKPALEQVEGVSQAEVVGGADREIVVRPDPSRLAIYDVTIEEIRGALARNNVSFPGGKIRSGPLYLSLRISGEFETLEEVAAVEIPRPGRTPIRVSDVAVVEDTVKEAEGATLLDARPVVSVLLYKEPEANTIRTAEKVDEALDILGADYGDFAHTFVYRDAEYVAASFAGLRQSLLLGAFLAFLILFFFLRDWRSPVVVGLAIPVSLAITFALFHFGGVKLNLMSLGGLSLAAGMLVDNAIVVLENINRHLGGGEPGADRDTRRRRTAAAAEVGTREMARPVVAATLTTVAVFFPVIYVPGIAGAFFRDQALAVTFSLLVSIAVALLLEPMLAARILAPGGEPRGVFRLFASLLEGWYRAYHRVLLWSLARPRTMLAALAVFLVAAGVTASRLPRSLMPERSSGDLRIELELPSGTPLEETVAVTGQVAEWLSEQPGVTWVFSQVGRTERTLASLREYTAPNTAHLRVVFALERGAHRKSLALEKAAAERLAGMAGVAFAIREEGVGLGEILTSGEAPFSLGVVAEEAAVAAEAADSLAARLAGIEGLTDLQVDRVLGTPNLVVRLDRDAILRSGLDPQAVSREVVNRVSGVVATTFNEVESRIDIAVRLPRPERRDLARLLTSPVEVQGGATVPLGTFLVLEEERPVRELIRRNQRRMVTLSGDVRDRSLEDVWEDADAVLAAASLPGGALVVPTGERTAMRKSFLDLGWAMLLAALLVYMILAAQFESFLDPFLIATVIPIGLAGAAGAILITGNSLNILSLIGAVALLGIAVNDAIVKIDTIRRLREEGVSGKEAVLEASRLRFRPILMTSATTVLAMVPMAIGLGSGEQLQRPLAVTIIGGLTLTTLLTLIYTPILYQMFHRLGSGGAGAEGTEPEEARA